MGRGGREGHLRFISHAPVAIHPGGALALLLLNASGATEPAHLWPDAPPAVLREELFGIRFRLLLRDKGPERAAKFLRDEMAARPGAPEVMAYVAWTSLFPEGWGMDGIVPPDTCEGLLRLAARAGSAVAKDVLGFALVHGGTPIADDSEEGLRLLQESAASGFARSIGRLGRLKIDGRKLERDAGGGMSDLLRAVALGSTKDLADLAEALEGGHGASIGLSHDRALREAAEYYFLLALENDGLGWTKLAEFEERGVPGARLLRSIAHVRFANEGGFLVPARVREHLAVLEREGRSDDRACVELGVAKLFGVDWLKLDPAGAKRCFEFAREMGNEEAPFFLAYMRLRGLAGPQDKPGALAEMAALADAGNVRANARLGYFHYWGAAEAGRLKKDPAKAFHYTRRAAELGSTWAQVNLAHCYKHGIGTKENPVLAAKLYWLATNHGVYGAKEDLLRQLAFAKIP